MIIKDMVSRTFSQVQVLLLVVCMMACHCHGNQRRLALSLDQQGNMRMKRQQSDFLCFSEVDSSMNDTQCVGQRLGTVASLEECCQPASIGGLEGAGYTQAGSPGCLQCPSNVSTDVVIRCYSGDMCSADSFDVVSDIRSCCLLDGERSFSVERMGTVGQCLQCVVVGWIDEPTITLAERSLSHPLTVNYLKGAEVGFMDSVFRVTSRVDTADNNDFSLTDPNLDLGDDDTMVTVTIRADSIALEREERFQLILEQQSRPRLNEIVLDTLDVVIQENDVANILLTELDYRLNPEDDGLLTIVVEVRTDIATPILLRLLPLNFTYVRNELNAGNLMLHPAIETEVNAPEDPDRPPAATSVADFDDTPILFQVNASGDFRVQIPITPDDIYEADQNFVILLEVANDSLSDLVEISRPAAVARIIDDDSITLGWEKPAYTYFEDVNGFVVSLGGAFEPPILIKEDNITTEYLLQFYTQPRVIQNTTLNNAEWRIPDQNIDNDFAIGTSSTGVLRGLPATKSFEVFEMDVFSDNIFNEGIEVAGLEFTNEENRPEFFFGAYPITQIIIIDRLLPVGFEREITMVSEGVGTFELCVMIFIPELSSSGTFEIANPFTLELLSVNGTADSSDYFEITSSDDPLAAFETDNSTHIQCFNVTIIDDTEFESTEEFMFTLTLEGPSTQSVIVEPNISLVQIVDNDAVTIGFEVVEHTVLESDGEITLIVSILEGDTSLPVTVTFSTVNGTAISGDDYSYTELNITLDEDNNSFNVTIPITVDTTVESDEQFSAFLTLVGPLEFSDRITIRPDTALINILDSSRPENVTRVNDTIIGDPLFTVPLRVSNLEEVGLEPDLSLCYEVHGDPDRYFNLVSDVCTSVNSHYTNVSTFNVIDNIGIRAVDESGMCREIFVSIEDACSVSVDGMNIESSYSADGVSVRRYPKSRVRLSVPNCAHLSLVMWMFCRNNTFTSYDEEDNPVVTETVSMKFVIARGYNLQERSHGLLGQFWNIPITIELYNDTLDDSSPDDTYYSVTVSHPDSTPRSFLALYYPRTWEVIRGQNDPCLYAGSYQAAAISHHPLSGSVIQGSYTDYIVSNSFETDYQFSKFETTRCS